MATTVFWVKKDPLSKEAINELKKIVPDMELLQLSEIKNECEILVAMCNSEIMTYQKGSLPPDLEKIIRGRNKVLEHEIDSEFNFTKWSWEKK